MPTTVAFLSGIPSVSYHFSVWAANCSGERGGSFNYSPTLWVVSESLLSTPHPVLHEGTMVIINKLFPLLFWCLESTFQRKLMKSLHLSHRFCVNSVKWSYGVFGEIRIRTRLHKARGTWFMWTTGRRLCKFVLKSWGVNLDSNMGRETSWN